MPSEAPDMVMVKLKVMVDAMDGMVVHGQSTVALVPIVAGCLKREGEGDETDGKSASGGTSTMEAR
jgi:hypothetical protein